MFRKRDHYRELIGSPPERLIQIANDYEAMRNRLKGLDPLIFWLEDNTKYLLGKTSESRQYLAAKKLLHERKTYTAAA
jgi:hypothetical protein